MNGLNLKSKANAIVVADDSRPPGSQVKKRRIPGACDVCKRRKIRCDSAQMPGNRCSHCIQLGFECTHKELISALGPAKGYVESLENRLEKMENLLAKLLPPGSNVSKEVDQGSISQGETPEAVETPKSEPEPESLPRNDDDDPSLALAVAFKKEQLFFGKSSGLRLLQTALEVKEEYTGEPAMFKSIRAFDRREFWEHPPWASYKPYEEELPRYTFPDDDLAPSLIDAYFVQINPFMPLLHRPTFQRLVDEGLHHVDPMFGAVYLLVCAHGARYSDDPRVLAEGTDSQRSAGWRWFEQIDIYRRAYIKKATLYELQRIALYIMFAHTSESPQGGWTAVGLGIRLAQDVGAHRKRRRGHDSPSAEDELWKRAFWVIFSIERIICSSSGRSCALQGEDLDLDLPLECDDEYWECGFQQPANKPSLIAYFNLFLGLMDILAHSMRTLYAVKHSNYRFAKISTTSDQECVTELDSTMNSWMDSVPPHLKWNPNRKNQLFLKQSAALHAVYYHLQIYIHRPFIPSPRNPLPSVFPSLAICTNAARSCCHVLEVFAHSSLLPFIHLQAAAFTSAVILLLNIWSGKRSGYAPNPLRYMEDVQRCLAILKASEQRWASAGRYWDILTELAYAGEVSLPEKNDHNSPPGRKRQRETSDDEVAAASLPGPPLGSTNLLSRKIAGSQRASMNLNGNGNGNGLSDPVYQRPAFPLPMYSNELGRLPIYGQHTFSDSYFHDPPPNHEFKLNSGQPHFQPSISSSASLPQNGSFSRSRRTAPDQDVPSEPPENLPSSCLNNGQLSWATAAESFANDVGNFLPSISLTANVTTDMYSQDMPAMDNDILNMWLTAPTSLELDDWNTYISTMGLVTQSRGQ